MRSSKASLGRCCQTAGSGGDIGNAEVEEGCQVGAKGKNALAARMAVNAVRMSIACSMFGQHEIDLVKVAQLVAHLRGGGEVAPVVVAKYGDRVLPIDGHHRLCAFAEVGAAQVDAWVVAGRVFDRLCALHRDAESHILCGGVPALQVADAWAERGCDSRRAVR